MWPLSLVHIDPFALAIELGALAIRQHRAISRKRPERPFTPGGGLGWHPYALVALRHHFRLRPAPLPSDVHARRNQARGCPGGNQIHRRQLSFRAVGRKESSMGRGILLWLLGVPIPIIILILLFWH